MLELNNCRKSGAQIQQQIETLQTEINAHSGYNKHGAVNVTQLSIADKATYATLQVCGCVLAYEHAYARPVMAQSLNSDACL